MAYCPLSKCFQTVSVVAFVMVLSSGCTVDMLTREQALSAIEQQRVLLKENEQLRDSLRQQEVALAQLQLSLVQNRHELARLRGRDTAAGGKSRVTTVRTPTGSTRVEAVAYLAEVATEIEANREVEHNTEDAELLQQADRLMHKSNAELEGGDYDNATLLASQAMTLVSGIERFGTGSVIALQDTPYEEFIAPLRMKIVRPSNIRGAPGMQSRLVVSMKAGTQVTALGHQATWIKVRLADGRLGWIYHTLLGIPALSDNP